MDKLNQQGKWGQTQMEIRMTAKGWGRLVCGRIEQKRKRTHGHGQRCGDCWGEEDKGTMVMEKNTIKIK